MGNLLQSPTKSYEFISGEYTAFEQMWLHTFYAVALSSIGMHIFAVITCLFTLMKHSKGRWYSILLIINAVFFPLIVGLISSAIIAGVYFVLDWSMESFVVIIWGMGQTILLFIMSMCRLLCTL